MERIAKYLGKSGSKSFSIPLWDPTNVNGSLTSTSQSWLGWMVLFLGY